MNTNKPLSQERYNEKASHGGCLIAWLILMIVVNSLALIVNAASYSNVVSHGGEN